VLFWRPASYKLKFTVQFLAPSNSVPLGIATSMSEIAMAGPMNQNLASHSHTACAQHRKNNNDDNNNQK